MDLFLLGVGSACVYHASSLIMRDTFGKPVMVALRNYTKLKGQSTPISELQLNLSDGESRYPVLLGGYVNCGDEEGKPITSLVGRDCCYQIVWDNKSLKKINEKYQDIYIKDDIEPNDTIFFPGRHINIEDTLCNVSNMAIEFVKDKVEMILPYKFPIFAIGKVQKKGNSLFLTPEETVPHSLYLLSDQNPAYFFNRIAGEINYNNFIAFCTFTVSLFFLGYGGRSFYRNRILRRN